MTDESLKAFRRVDILVNNAGISGPTKRNHRHEPRRMARGDRYRSDGAWLASRAVIPQ